MAGMAGKGLPVGRLREFLRDLRPEARMLLIREMERAKVEGAELPAADVVLQELYRLQEEAQAKRGLPRPFFDQFTPFVFDGSAPAKVQGRIPRSSLEAIWQWIGRDVAPAQTAAFEAAIEATRADQQRADEVSREFQTLVIAELETVLAKARADEKAQRRLAGQIAVAGAVNDLEDVLAILKARAELAQISARLPLKIKNLADDQLDHVKTVLTSPVARAHDVFGYALILVMSRLAQPWQLIRFAVKAADSDVAARIADTRYGYAVSLVLSEIERSVAGLREDYAKGALPVTVGHMKDIHDALRGVRTEIDLSGDTAWARQLASIRSAVSQFLRGEIEDIPGQVRRLLRVRPAGQTPVGAVLDEFDVAEAETRMELLGACRNYASELALNESTLRIHSDLQNYMETHANALVEKLRLSSEPERGFVKSQTDAAVRVCSKLFGSDYAALLAKAVDVAAGDERKAARG